MLQLFFQGSYHPSRHGCHSMGHTPSPEGPRIEKIQSREALLRKSSFQYGMKFSIENGFFIPGPSLTAEKQGPGLKFSIENENFKLRMKISCENENFVRGGMVFSCVRARMNFFDPGAPWEHGWDLGKKFGKFPERPWKRSQSVSWNSPRESGWDPPNPISQGI